MQCKNEREACKAWVASFYTIPTVVMARAYKEGDRRLQLVAGGERLSNCCSRTAKPTFDDDDALTGFECPACRRPCRIHWGGSTYGWPGAWTECFSPREPLDDTWMRDHAELIADSCGVLVYDSDDVGIVLALDTSGGNLEEDYWLPLYRERGLQWHVPVKEDPPARTRRRKRTKR